MNCLGTEMLLFKAKPFWSEAVEDVAKLRSPVQKEMMSFEAQSTSHNATSEGQTTVYVLVLQGWYFVVLRAPYLCVRHCYLLVFS